MTSALELPQCVVERACQLFHRIATNDLIYGRSIEDLSTAAVYIATRQTGFPRTVAELCPVSHGDHKAIFSAYRHIASELAIALRPLSPEQFIPRLVSAHETDNRTRRIATQLIEYGHDHIRYAGKNPMSIAAGALHAASKLTGNVIMQTAIADTASISTLTIRHRAEELLEHASEAIDPELQPEEMST